MVCKLSDFGFFQSAEIVAHVFHEMELHIGYCEGFGISREEMENTEEKEGEHPPVSHESC